MRITITIDTDHPYDDADDGETSEQSEPRRAVGFQPNPEEHA